MVYLIDASVYSFRAWYAVAAAARCGGNPTHALYGFARFLGDLIERRAPPSWPWPSTRAAAAGHRHALLLRTRPIANRRRRNSSASSRCAAEFCRHLGVAEFASREYEADDLSARWRKGAR